MSRGHLDQFDEELGDLVESFEEAWIAGQNPDIDAYLPSNPDQRNAALWELAETELELALRTGSVCRVEDYVTRYPEMADQPQRLADFVHSEYRVRSQIQPDVRFAEYRKRFPELDSFLVSADSQFGHPSLGVKNEGVANPVAGDEPSGKARFRLLRSLGEGGLGRVWAAWDHDFEREVAVKEIKPRYANQQKSRERFQTEARITGQLQHSGVPSVFARGLYPDGRPYYAMQIVEGKTLQHAIKDLHNPEKTPPRQFQFVLRNLLARFKDMCETVHYAHTQGVLHRDIKPRNIMLGEYGETVVLDWGLAKVVGESQVGSSWTAVDSNSLSVSSSDSDLTRAGDTIGSPDYMSPEQARHEHQALAPTSDVYSLGATLYTILTNQVAKAYSRADDGHVEKQKLERPTGVCRHIPAAVESICLKALAFDSEDRFKNAKDLAVELEHFLADEKVKVHEESLLDRLTRRMRRNRGAFAVAILALGLLAGLSSVFAFVSSRQASEAIAAERFATVEQARSQQLMEALIGTYTSPFSDLEFDREMKIVDSLNHVVKNARISMSDDPANLGVFLDRIAQAQLRLGEIEKAESLANEATKLLGTIDEVKPIMTHETTVSEVALANGHLNKAISSLEKSLPELRAEFGESHKQSIRAATALAVALAKAAEYEKSLELLDANWNLVDRKLDSQNSQTWGIALGLSSVYRNLGRKNDAMQLAARIHEFARREFGEASPLFDNATHELAVCYFAAEDWQKAEELLDDLLERETSREGVAHPRTLKVIQNLAAIQLTRFEIGKALPKLERLRDLTAKTRGKFHPDSIEAAYSLADGYHRSFLYQKALDLNEETLEIAKQVYGKRHFKIADFESNLSTNLGAVGRNREALAHCETAHDIFLDTLGIRNPHTVVCMRNLADNHAKLGEMDEAIQILQTYLDNLGDDVGQLGSIDLLSTKCKIGEFQVLAGNSYAALPELEKATRKLIEKIGAKPHPVWHAMNALQSAQLYAGQSKALEATCSDWIDQLKEEVPEGTIAPAMSHLFWADALINQSMFQKAKKQVQIAKQILDPYPREHGGWVRINAVDAVLLAKAGSRDSAEKSLLGLMESLEETTGADVHLIKYVAYRLAELYDSLDQPDKAVKWRTAERFAEESVLTQPHD